MFIVTRKENKKRLDYLDKPGNDINKKIRRLKSAATRPLDGKNDKFRLLSTFDF